MTFRIAWKPYMYNADAAAPARRREHADAGRVGAGGRVVPLECGERYAKALPQARLAVVDGAGHFVEMEQPEQLARLIGGTSETCT